MKCPRCDTSGALFNLCPTAYVLYEHQAAAHARAMRLNTEQAWELANAARREYEQHIGVQETENANAATDW